MLASTRPVYESTPAAGRPDSCCSSDGAPHSLRTEESYLGYIKEFFLFHNKRHARELGVPEIRAYLSHLAVEPKVGHQLRMWRSVPCCFFIVEF